MLHLVDVALSDLFLRLGIPLLLYHLARSRVAARQDAFVVAAFHVGRAANGVAARLVQLTVADGEAVVLPLVSDAFAAVEHALAVKEVVTLAALVGQDTMEIV